ncbi:MAG: amidohydrolase family protein [Chloroflexota bacterium]
MEQLIRAAKIVCLDAADTILEPGYAIMASGSDASESDASEPSGNGRFTYLSDIPPTTNLPMIDLGNRLLMPGLVNAHTHTPMTLFRGLAEGHSLFDFDGWYNTIRVVEEVMTPNMVPPAVLVSCAEMIRTGTTCFADQYFWMDQIVPAVHQSGMRAALGYGIVELGEEAAREREIAATAVFLDSLQDDPLLTGWVGPHAFFVDNSEAAIVQELDLAERFETGLHIHLSTSGEEDRFCQANYGQTAVPRMAQLGILNHRLLAAHCLTIPESDYPLLAKAPFTAVIAPSSAMRNAAGFAQVREMAAAGINLALGTDNVTNNNSYDLFKEMQILGKLASLHYRTPNALPTRDLLHMATQGGADALGLGDEIGSIEIGKQADFISLDLDEIGWSPTVSQDVYTALVYAISGMHVRDVAVAGKWLYRNGRFQTIDYAQAVQDLEKAALTLQHS